MVVGGIGVLVIAVLCGSGGRQVVPGCDMCGLN